MSYVNDAFNPRIVGPLPDLSESNPVARPFSTPFRIGTAVEGREGNSLPSNDVIPASNPVPTLQPLLTQSVPSPSNNAMFVAVAVVLTGLLVLSRRKR